MAEEPLEERTEEPTPRRREEARRKGQIVKSRELSSVAVLGASFFTFLTLGYMFFQQIYIIFHECFNNSYYNNFDINIFIEFINNILGETNKILLPFFVLVSLVAIIVYLIQTGGGVWAYEAISLKFDRINPVEGFKRLFSLTALFELFKSLIKLAIIIGVSYWIIEKYFYNILKLFGADVPYLALSFKLFIKDFIIKLLFILTLLAVLDWLYNRWDVERKLKLTRQELKEELKQTEGDPWVKARIRQKQREMNQRRMLAEVPKADVVITNPTHYAVALKYEMDKMPAPQVVAKGKDFLAQKIKEIALENKVPIYEDPPLARLLYEKVEIEEYIPEELYQVVAKVLAYVYKLKNKK